MSALHVGTSGWSYPWKDWFYPAGLKSADYLAYYATRFDCVEVNSSFYHLTQVKTIEKWLAATPDHFRFAVKMNRSITHEQQLRDANGPADDFLARFEAMGKRLGPVLVQLPASLGYDPAVASPFFQHLREKHPDHHFALEVRHRSWMTEEALEMLRNCRIAWVIADAGRRFPRLETVTADFVYLRFHGAERLYASAYSEEQLAHYARLTGDWLKEGKTVWAFFNNTMEGHAVANAEWFREFE